MYTFSKQTRDKFLDKEGIDLNYFCDELCSNRMLNAIITLTEIEYERGREAEREKYEGLMEEQYNAGYDDGYNDATNEPCADAYNEGFGQALEEVQDAILRIGRSK